MLILIPVLLMGATALTLIILRLVRPQFRFSWLIAVGASFVGWILVLLWRTTLPISISLGPWAPTPLLTTTPALHADQFSWLYALALLTLTLAAVLTEPLREGFPSSITLAIMAGVCALGLVAVTAANPLTLALVWAALDLTELAAMLATADGRSATRQVVTSFSVHSAATVLLMLAQVISSAGDKPVDFAGMTPRAGLVLLVAAGLRLGVLPLHLPYVPGSARRRGIGTSLRLVSAAAGLLLLSRVPTASIPSLFGALILVVSAGVALYAGWMWLRAPDELAGRPYWIIGMASLALYCAMRGNPQGAAAWGVTLILVGAALFLSSVQHTWVSRLLFVGAFEASSLPLSITATGWNGQPGAGVFAMPFFIAAQALMLAGFIRHAMRPALRAPLQQQPMWARSVYPAAIGLLLLVPFVFGLWGWDGALQVGMIIPGIVAALLSTAIVWAVPRLPILNPVPAHWLRPSASTSWLERLSQGLLGIYHWFGRVSFTLSDVLEGEGGLMWTLLFLVLFILLLVQRNP